MSGVVISVLACYHYSQFVSTLGFFAGKCVHPGPGDMFPLLAYPDLHVASSVVVMAVHLCPPLSIFLSWGMPFADGGHPWLDNMFPLLNFALVCLGSLEWAPEVVALEWVSQFLCQTLVDLYITATDKIILLNLFFFFM